MDRLREAVELLSKLLYENASLKIRAEVFRAAKFNSAEAVTVIRCSLTTLARCFLCVPDNATIGWLMDSGPQFPGVATPKGCNY